MPFDKTFATHPHVKPARKRTKHVGRPIGNAAAARAAISVAVALADSGAILLAALAAGTIYHAAFYEAAGMWESHVAIGGVVAALFCVACVLRRDYEVPSLLSFKDNIPRLCALWSVAFLSLAILAFATKTGADVSRGTIFILYIFGLAAVLAERAIVARIVLDQASAGGVAARRVFLVGCEEDIARCAARFESPGSGVRVVSSAVLRGEDSLDDDLALAAAMARVLRPDDVYILVPWSRSHMVESAIDVFLRVPAALHLGPGRVLDRFPKARLERVGPVVSVNLDRQPLGLLDFAVKRALDIVVAGAALVALSPVFAVVALLIKLESPGPVLFRQRRYGFNQEPFHIFKFRSMNTMEDGREVVQATVGDSRITRVGRFIAQRACRRHVACGPAATRDGPRPDVRARHRALRAAPQHAPRHFRLGAGQRVPRRNLDRRQNARAHRTRSSIHRQMVDFARSENHVSDGVFRQGLPERVLRAATAAQARW